MFSSMVEIAVQRETLRQVADERGDGAVFGGRILTEHAHLPAGGPQQAARQPDRRRLSGAVGSDEAEHLAGSNGQRDVAQRGALAVFVGHPSERQGLGAHRGSSASTGMPDLRMPCRLSTVTLIR